VVGLQAAVEQQPGQAGGASMGKALTWQRLSLALGSGSGRLLILLLYLADEKTLEVSSGSIDLLHLKEHRRFHIRQPNGDGLHLTSSTNSNCSNFSAIASLQNDGIFRQWLLFSRSSAWWSC